MEISWVRETILPESLNCAVRILALAKDIFLKLGLTPFMAMNSHYEAWSYKKNQTKNKKIKAYMKSV